MPFGRRRGRGMPPQSRRGRGGGSGKCARIANPRARAACMRRQRGAMETVAPEIDMGPQY